MDDQAVLMLSGINGSGKTETLRRLITEIEGVEIKVGGLLAPGRFTESGSKEYDLELIPGHQIYHLSTRMHFPAWQPLGGFRFNPEAVDAGQNHLKTLIQRKYEIHILDEIGPFELEGFLWADGIPALLESKVPLICTIRPQILDEVQNHWKFLRPTIIRISGEKNLNIKSIIEWISRHIPRYRGVLQQGDG
jgi:nucleoside-triphosphatase